MLFWRGLENEGTIGKSLSVCCQKLHDEFNWSLVVASLHQVSGELFCSILSQYVYYFCMGLKNKLFEMIW
jgi:hypothetical protein